MGNCFFTGLGPRHTNKHFCSLRLFWLLISFKVKPMEQFSGVRYVNCLILPIDANTLQKYCFLIVKLLVKVTEMFVRFFLLFSIRKTTKCIILSLEENLYPFIRRRYKNTFFRMQSMGSSINDVTVLGEGPLKNLKENKLMTL